MVEKFRDPDTLTGMKLPVVVPFPSWPCAPRPQQYATPPLVKPQVKESPAVRLVQVSAAA
jgi:hypothetical protein